jgi:hypothetical protein
VGRGLAGSFVAAIWLALMAPSAVALPPVNVPLPGQVDAIAYSGGRVVWATHTRHGPIVVHQASIDGSPQTVLATVARARPSAQHVTVELAANETGYLLAARDGREVDTGPCGCNFFISLGELVVMGGYDAAQTTLVNCRPSRPKFDDEQIELRTVAGRSGFAFAGALCGAPGPVVTVSPEGTVAVAGKVRLRAGQLYGFSYSEPHVAIRTAAGRIRILDTSTATAIDRTPPTSVSGYDFWLQADGTLVLGPSGYSGSPDVIYRWPPDATRPVVVPDAKLSQARQIAVGPAGILYSPLAAIDGRLALGLAEDGTGAVRPVGAPGAGFPRTPLGVDASGAAFTNRSCEGVDQVTVVDVTETTRPAAPDGCPVEVEPETIDFAQRGRGLAGVRCPNGCSGELEMAIDLRPRQLTNRELNRYVDKVFSSTLARGKFALAPGQDFVQVPLRLTRPAIKLLGRHRGGLRVFPALRSRLSGPEIPQPAPRMLARLR